MSSRGDRRICDVQHFPERRTYSPPASRAVVLPSAAVRSPRGMRRLRTPFSQYRCARLAGQLASVSQRSAWLHHAGALTRLASCGRKPATGRFPAGEPRKRGTTEKTEVIPNSNLPPGGKGHQPRRGAFCCRGCGLHELLANLQRLRRRAARLH